MSQRAFVVVAATILGSVGAAQGAFFSFASDVDSSSWTFSGIGAGVRDAQDPTDPQLLLVDDANGPLPTLPFQVDFDADFTIAYVNSVMIVPGMFVHAYAINGTFTFRDAQGVLLTASIENGALTALGDAQSWFSTATIQGSDSSRSSVAYTWFGASIDGYDLLPGSTQGPDDAAFTLTQITSAGSLGVPLGQDFLPLISWTSEGSYSGAGRNFVPSAGSAALLGIAGLMTARRRRSN